MELEPGAEHAWAFQPHVGAETGCGPTRRRGVHDLVDEAEQALRRGGWLVELLERVEEVAPAKLRPDVGEHVGPRHCVEAEHFAEPEHRAALARLGPELRRECIELPLARAEQVPVGETDPSRSAWPRTVFQTSCCATPRASGSAERAAAFRRRSSAFTMWGAGEKLLETERQRPCSVHDTGMRSVDPAATSTLTFRIRFCFAPTSSAPSYSRTSSASGFATVSSGTSPASLVSVIVSPRASAASSVMYRARGSRSGNSGAMTIPRCSTGSPSWNGNVVVVKSDSFRQN